MNAMATAPERMAFMRGKDGDLGRERIEDSLFQIAIETRCDGWAKAAAFWAPIGEVHRLWVRLDASENHGWSSGQRCPS